MIGLMPDRIDFLLGKLIQNRVIRGTAVRPSPMASFDDLKAVHSSAYLESVTHPENVSRIVGMELELREADEFLRSQRRAVGGTISAAEAVVNGDVDIGVNLGGGFHHAEEERGSGFCVFNDVAIAIRHLRAKGFKENIAIVDLDFHQGNGNLAIFAHDPTVYTYSVHGAVWDDREAVSDLGILLPPATDDYVYLRRLGETLLPELQKHWPKLIFYIAGNDVLAGDRLGTFALTPTGVLRRDKRVTRIADALDSGLVVVMGGGYSPTALQCTENFVTFLQGKEVRIGQEFETDLRAKFTEISRTITSEDLGEAPLISEADLISDLGRLSRPQLLLDLYSLNGIEFAFERYGILAKIRDHGFSHFHFEMDTADPDKQLLRLYARKKLTGEKPLLLLEVVVRKVNRQLPLDPSSAPVTLLDVNWLLIQDPLAEFVMGRRPLPGQEHPGLGIAEDIQEMLVQLCRRANLDGVSGVPSHFHNASVASRWFHYLDPKVEGCLLALRQTLIPYLLPDASQLVETGRLRLKNETAVPWEPNIHVLPVSPRLKAYFEKGDYWALAQRECQRLLDAGLHVTGDITDIKGFFSGFQNRNPVK